MKGFERPMASDRLADLGRLAGSLAHEIKNPLGVVVMNADLVLSQRPAGISDDAWERLQARVQRIRAAATALQGTVQGFLAYARPDRPAAEPVDVNHVISVLVDEIREGYAAEGIALAFHPDQAIAKIAADPQHLRSIFLNILLNARDALRDRDQDRRILVLTRGGTGNVRIVLANNGPPLPDRVATHLFEPFVSGKAEGTGLGLAIVRRLVELHHGTVKVSSDPAQGVSFAIEFPAAMTRPRRALAITHRATGTTKSKSRQARRS